MPYKMMSHKNKGTKDQISLILIRDTSFFISNSLVNKNIIRLIKIIKSVFNHLCKIFLFHLPISNQFSIYSIKLNTN